MNVRRVTIRRRSVAVIALDPFSNQSNVVNDSPTLAIVMSRLPRLVPPEAVWLRGLRAALRRVAERGAKLMIGEGTAGADFIRRGAERVGISPALVSRARTETEETPKVPAAADRAVLDAAEMVFVLGLRTGGNLHRLLGERLDKQRPVELVDLPDLQATVARNDLLQRGASLWKPDPAAERPLNEPGVCEKAGTEPESHLCEIVPFPSRDDWTFLTHTTRGCPGPWPGQTEDDYLDSLLDGRFDADHSCAATLARLIAMRRLLASGRTIRGGHRVVSFTAVPLLELPPLHRFRAHRARWDFEPFGLCVRRDWLLQRGVRPVVYGDEPTWHGLGEADRPYFQLARSEPRVSTPTGTTMDWTVEQEWRHKGDLDLSDLSREDGLVFVPNYESVRRVSPVSPWPVTLWPDPAFDGG